MWFIKYGYVILIQKAYRSFMRILVYTHLNLHQAAYTGSKSWSHQVIMPNITTIHSRTWYKDFFFIFFWCHSKSQGRENRVYFLSQSPQIHSFTSRPKSKTEGFLRPRGLKFDTYRTPHPRCLKVYTHQARLGSKKYTSVFIESQFKGEVIYPRECAYKPKTSSPLKKN